jgi:outer membrane protein assembly factor BamB
VFLVQLAIASAVMAAACGDDDGADDAGDDEGHGEHDAAMPRDAAAPVDAGRVDDAGAPDPADPNSWRMMGYDSTNQYFNPAETELSPDNAGSLVEKWRFTVAGFPPGSPVIADGKVFVMATGGTYALDLETGAALWTRMDLSGTASIAYDDGFVYVHTLAAELHKLDAIDGTSVWGPAKTYDLEGCEGVSSPIIAAGKVFVGHSCGGLEARGMAGQALARGGVEAHDLETGEKAWTYFTVPDTGENGAMVWSSVSIDVDGESVFATTGNNYTVAGENSDAFHAIELADGALKWKTQVREGDLWSIPMFITGPDTDFGANPILARFDGRDLVAAGDKASAFWALDRATGEILWQREDLSTSHTPNNGGVLMNGAFDGTYFYVVSNQPPQASVLHALDPADGADAWTRDFTATAWGAPSVANGVLLVPVDSVLHVLDARSGEELTMFDTGGTIAAGAAAIAQGRVVVKSGLQYVFDSTAKNNNQIICYGLP